MLKILEILDHIVKPSEQLGYIIYIMSLRNCTTLFNYLILFKLEFE